MKNFFHIGADAEETEEQFDPSKALAGLGVAIPQEIEVEESPPVEEAPEMDLSAFRTVDHADANEEEDELVLDEPVAAINPKDLIGVKKPDLTLVPPAGMLWESQAMMDGAAKYGPYNWRSNPVFLRVYIAAAMRHLQQLLDGEDFDPKSGVHHVGHARACLGIIADAAETGNLKDDRPVKGPAGDMIRRFEETQSFMRPQQP